jgi:hypothetical protein
MWIAGGNHHIVRNNHIYDNWRRGTMLFTVPDALVCGPHTGNEQAGCDPSRNSTSHFNTYSGNTMGEAPNGTAKPNGLDFWWDDFPNSKGNCWYQNTGPAPVTTSPSALPDCDDGANPNSSVGNGDPANEGELLLCAAAFESEMYNPDECPWFASPKKPGTQAARVQRRRDRALTREAFYEICGVLGADGPTCAPFSELLSAG